MKVDVSFIVDTLRGRAGIWPGIGMAVWYRFSSTRLVVLAIDRCCRLARDAQEQFFGSDFQAVLRLPGNGLGLQCAGEGTDMLDWIPVCQELERLIPGFVWCGSIHPANRTE